MPRALLLSALPLLLVACGDKDPDDSGAESDDTGSLDCTTEAVVSVHVTIELGDDVTAIPEDLAVTYAVDGGSPQPCESWSGELDWACGFEVAGDLVIEATAEGYEPASAAVTVESDACHVIPETLTLTLEPEITAGG